MVRTAVLLLLLSILSIAVGASGCGQKPAAEKHDTEKGLLVQQVVASKPQRKTLTLTTTQPGRIDAFEETPLYAKMAGYVAEVLVDIGDVVHKDQTLIKLSIPELLDDVEQKEALIAQAEAEVKQAQSAVVAAGAAAKTAQSKIKEMEAGISRAEAELERWKSEHERIKDLAEKGSVTKKLEDETFSQLRSAEATTREVSAKADSSRTMSYEAQANVGKAEADQGAAEARLRVAKADLAHAKTMLAYTQIKSPYDGTVTRRDVDTGHFVQPASSGAGKPLMVVARTDKVRIFVNVPEMEAPYVDADDPAKVRVQALTESEFDAAVVRSSWSLQESNRSLRAEIDVPNPHGILRPGMYAMATIKLAERENALVLPATAIVRDAAGTACMAVEDGKIVRCPVELGLRSGSEIEILSGIEENQLIVLKQTESLKTGQSVGLASPAM
jgi:RND family efflux transporter MFP subunit